MKCLKCGHIESGNFCSHCGEQLKRQCFECGRMESINVRVCLGLIDKIRKEERKYILENIGWKKYFSYHYMVTGQSFILFCWFILLVCLVWKHDWGRMSLSLIDLLVVVLFPILLCGIWTIYNRKFFTKIYAFWAEKFYSQFPYYRAILEKYYKGGV